MIDLRHLHAVAALAATGSVTRAAARLHLTQSALSHQFAALEGYLGVTLVERGRRPMVLTPSGEILLQLARRVLPELEAARQTLARMKAAPQARELRIAVECHTCFEWLMPAMDAYREAHPEVEMDLVGGFHPDPAGLLDELKADLVILSETSKRPGIVHFPLFRFEIVALLAHRHHLADKPYLDAADFAAETLVTYPVPDRMLDLVHRVLTPAGVNPLRRTAELTVAILQLVASHRGLAALPRWAVQSYLDRGYVAARRIGKDGLWSALYAAVRETDQAAYADFATVLTDTAFATLKGPEHFS